MKRNRRLEYPSPTNAQSLRNLRHGIVLLGDLAHRVAFELIAEIGFAHQGLLALNLGKKAS